MVTCLAVPFGTVDGASRRFIAVQSPPVSKEDETKEKRLEPTLHLLPLVSSHQTTDEADVENEENDANDANEQNEHDGHFFLDSLNRRHSVRPIHRCKSA